MTDEELQAAWVGADCPLTVERCDGGVRITWTDDPLDFITLAPKAALQLVRMLEEATAKP